MKIIAFKVRGALAHFRKPDTTATHLTYPFITPTAAKGLVGAILGIEDFVTTDRIGIQLLNPVQTVAQQMSMLGKDSGPSFNRPTTIELLVNPSYLIYYSGKEYGDQLLDALEKETSVYPTYLGSAYALTKPVLQDVYRDEKETGIETHHARFRTIAPVSIVEEIIFQPERQYSRAGGFLWHYTGKRTFEKSIDFLYERSGKSIEVRLNPHYTEAGVTIGQIGDEHICLI